MYVMRCHTQIHLNIYILLLISWDATSIYPIHHIYIPYTPLHLYTPCVFVWHLMTYINTSLHLYTPTYICIDIRVLACTYWRWCQRVKVYMKRYIKRLYTCLFWFVCIGFYWCICCVTRESAGLFYRSLYRYRGLFYRSLFMYTGLFWRIRSVSSLRGSQQVSFTGLFSDIQVIFTGLLS